VSGSTGCGRDPPQPTSKDASARKEIQERRFIGVAEAGKQTPRYQSKNAGSDLSEIQISERDQAERVERKSEDQNSNAEKSEIGTLRSLRFLLFSYRSFHRRKRNALPMTIMSENPMAAAQRIGLMKPSAAKGMPTAL
jgi:hypothetical protein